MGEIKSIGISGYYLNSDGIYINNTAYGANVAALDLLKGLIKYSSSEEICFSYVKDFYQHLSVERLYKQFKMRGFTSANLKIINRIDMLQKNAKIDSDILHDFSEDFYHTVFLRETYASQKPPITYTIHAASAPFLKSRSFLLNLFVGLKPYDSLICSSQAVKEVVEARINQMVTSVNELYNTNIKYKCRLDLVPLGINEDEVYKIDKHIARRELNISNETFVILYFGRVSAYTKGDILPLIKVLRNLVVKNPKKDIMLIIAGTEDNGKQYYLSVEKYISDLKLEEKVKIIKKYPYENRNVLYSAADVFTSPSDNIQETFGLTPIEAMACGIPQVVSDWDGYKETVRHGVTGFRIPTYWSKCDDDISMFPPDVGNEFGSDLFYSHFLLSQSVVIDLDLYENYFQQLIDYPELGRKMSENSIEIFKREYTLKNVIMNYEELWKELIAIKKSSDDEKNKQYLSLFNNSFCDTFASYPTRFIDDNEIVAITESGKNFLEGMEPLPFHYREEAVLNEFNIAKDLLRNVASIDCRHITDLIKTFNEEINDNVIRRSIMWLLKHGFIKLK